MEVNKIHNINFLENTLPDKCANLIIADPPYFEVKGDFDFIWKSFDDYLKDVEKWAIECKRILAENGTIYWFGGSKRIAYTQVIFDKYFGLVNNLVWEKAEADGLFGSTGSKQLRSYPNSTERILMYSNEHDVNALGEIYDDPNNFTEIKQYLRSEKQKSGLKSDWFVSASSTYCSHYFALTSQWAFPTEKDYKAFQKSGFFQKPYEDLRKEYEDLRKEYEELRRTFENVTKSTEVLKVRFKPSEYDHPTVKPEMLARLLILTSSRKNDLVVVPFSGSGTECAMAVKEGRKTIGFEIEEKYAKMSNNRVQNILHQPSLFVGS